MIIHVLLFVSTFSRLDTRIAMRRDCRMMLRRFDDECNTTNFTTGFNSSCNYVRNSHDYRRIYYRVQHAGEDCFIQR